MPRKSRRAKKEEIKKGEVDAEAADVIKRAAILTYASEDDIAAFVSGETPQRLSFVIPKDDPFFRDFAAEICYCGPEIRWAAKMILRGYDTVVAWTFRDRGGLPNATNYLGKIVSAYGRRV